MRQIKVQQKQDHPSWKFEVEIVEDGSISRHKVSMSKEFYTNLETDREPIEVIKKSFEFLLECEPKESILPEFNVSVISHYFPEYEEALKNSLVNSI